MLSLPDSAQPLSQARLPWPEGSVIPARLMPTDAPGSALLIIGGYRLLAEVPPNIPMGEVWMQLINRETPASFRLLNDAQLLQLVSQMLTAREEEADPPPKGRENTHHADAKPSHVPSQRSQWPHLDGKQPAEHPTGLPWHGESTADGAALLWYDDADNQPRGMMHRHVEEQSFRLGGRVDLDRLGPVVFEVRGKTGSTDAAAHGWSMNLHATREPQLELLRRDFAEWLLARREAYPDISGKIIRGLPDAPASDAVERTA